MFRIVVRRAGGRAAQRFIEPSGLRETLQDMPPPGGYPEVEWKQGGPKRRGPPGWVILGTVTLMVTTGFYRLGCANVEQNVGKKERRAPRRFHLYRRRRAHVAAAVHPGRRGRAAPRAAHDEAIVMKDVPGWVVGESVYNTKNKKHWMPPTRFCHPKQW